jgi:competence CoiA-like predicted nuclease
MRYALNESHQKIEVAYSGQRALCPGCNKEVTGKIYKSKKNHWAHLNADCDNWYEPLSEWHIKWQNYFPQENQEVTLIDKINNEIHRADIYLNNGVVIEIQNSPIVIKEVSEREAFYNRKGLIWILNAANLIPKSTFINYLKPDNCLIKIKFFRPLYYEFNTNTIINELKEMNCFSFDKNYEYSDTKDEINYTLYSNSLIDLSFEEDKIKSSIESITLKNNRALYNRADFQFKVEIDVVNNKFTLHKFLYKTQWRKFIDEMSAPVFLDNVTDLHTDYLYWVQRQKIIKKEEFIKKYVAYTKTAANNGYRK